MNIAILIMAAGESSRLGQPKQLLPYQGKTLIEHTIEECVESKVGPVYLILGSRHEEIEEQISTDQVQILKNPRWEKGLGTSIAFGIDNLSASEVDGAIVVLADQPFFNREILLDIKKKREETGSLIVSSKYKNASGPPTFFDQSLFSELKEIDGDDGAKSVVKRHKDHIAFVSFKEGDIDIDRPEDLIHLK